MRRCSGGVKGLVLALFGVWFVLSGCSEGIHDCYETRTCPAPIGFVDAGNFDNWWSAGAAGENAAPADAPAAVGLSAGGAAGGLSAGGAAGGLSAGGAAAGDNAAGAPSRPPDEAPSLLGVSPSDGAVGVPNDASIVLRFSQPIDARSFEAAYESADLPAGALVFSWNEAQTTLTLKPKAALEYQTGNAEPDGAVAFPPKTYQYGFRGFTSDALGHVLAEQSFGFSTLRQASAELAADPARTGNWTDGEGEGIHNCLRGASAPYAPTVCIGDDSNNVRYTGFVSFDLSRLPTSVSEFSSARLRASALVYGSTGPLGPSLLEHVAYGELGQAALTATPSAILGGFYGAADLSSGAHFELAEDVTRAVQKDYASRRLGSSFTQYRLGFAKVAANGAWDDIELLTSSLALSMTYLLP